MSEISAGFVVTLVPTTMMPPISPRVIRASTSASGLWPDMRTTSFWPINCSNVGPEAGSDPGVVGLGGVGVALVVGVSVAATPVGDAATPEPDGGEAPTAEVRADGVAFPVRIPEVWADSVDTAGAGPAQATNSTIADMRTSGSPDRRTLIPAW